MGLFDKFKKKTIDDYAEEGNSLCDQGKLDEAIEIWAQGLKILPEPLNSQSEAVWFQTSIGDTYFMQNKFDKSYEWLFEAKSNLSGAGYSNPFVMMRLGQSALEIGKIEEAREYLLRAYMLEGEDIFSDEDKKYLDSIRDLINQG
jgi:tetratricopeptide (TPR) repeat protein